MKLIWNLNILILCSILFFSFSHAIDINSCQDLNQTNSVYNLTSNVNTSSLGSNCFNILANNITLELNGFNITSVGGGVAVELNSFNSSTIKNGFIRQFRRGINISESDYNVVQDIYVSSPAIFGSRCMQLYSSEYNIVNRISCENFSSLGIGFEEASNNYVYNSNFTGSPYGIHYLPHCVNNIFYNVRSENNSVQDFYGGSRNMTGTIFQDSYILKYRFLDFFTNGVVTFKQSNFGQIKYESMIGYDTSGINLSNDILFENNRLYIDFSGNKSGLNKSINVTFYNIPSFSDPVIFRNGHLCGSLCSNFTSLQISNISFRISPASDYSSVIYNIGERPVVIYSGSPNPIENISINEERYNITASGKVKEIVTSDKTQKVLVIVAIVVFSLFLLNIYYKRKKLMVILASRY